MHIAIAGGGIFGQVIAWRLALRGHRVTVVEPAGPGAFRTGSGDRSRIVRALHDKLCLARSGLAALELWTRWSSELGVRLIEPVGVLYIEGPSGSKGAAGFRAWIDKGLENLRELGGEVATLDGFEAAKRWPALSHASVRRVEFEKGGGFGRPALAARAIARAALTTGNVTHVPGAALRIQARGSAAWSISVNLTSGGSIVVSADVVVIAAGFRGAELVRPFLGHHDMGIRSVPHWTSYWDVPYPGGADLFMGKLPAWIDLGSNIYGFPDDGESGFKVAWHEPGKDPSEIDEASPTAEDLEAIRKASEARFPAMREASYRGYYPCAYDVSPDEMFRVGAVPNATGLYFVGGMSGHGFKHAPSIGESIAAVISGEPPLLDLSPYALRF